VTKNLKNSLTEVLVDAAKTTSDISFRYLGNQIIHPPLLEEQYSFQPLRTRVVTSDVFRENHVRRTSSGRVQTNVRVGRPPADGTGGCPLADGPGGRPVLRQSVQPPYRKTARNIITFFNFFSPLQGSPSSTVAPRVTPQSYFLL
jgi:hypothetical protein